MLLTVLAELEVAGEIDDFAHDVTGLPGCGLLSTAAATVVADHGSLGLVPIVAIGWSYVPLSTFISVCRMPFCAHSVKAATAAKQVINV